MHEGTAASRWSILDAERQGFITRCEKYSAFTVPKICTPEGYDKNSTELQHDYQSLGAQAVNHLSNKLMLALFAPSRPFFRLDPSEKLESEMDGIGMTKDDLSTVLSLAEQKAVRELDRRPIRPRLYDAMKHIVVTGNALLVLEKSNIRVLGIKNYVVKRDVEGEMLETITREYVDRKSLDPKVVEVLAEKLVADMYGKVELFKWITRNDDGYEMTTWVGQEKLPAPFEGKWTKENLPYHPITWDLASGDDYGTGLVEDYAGDFAALSIMSKATVQAAILASEFRWLVNPAGMTRPEDLQNSENGAALPGVAGDINLVQSGKSADLQVNVSIAQMYITRIGQGFLLTSAMIRQAERVTAEEIRRLAEELENSLGGGYSHISTQVQVPLAYWLMEMSGKKISGTDIEPTIVTGLAALSRSGDRDNLILFIQDITTLGTLPPEMQARMRIPAIQAAFAAARGLNPAQYLLTEAEFQQQQEAAQQQALADQAAEAGTQVAAEQAAQQE